MTDVPNFWYNVLPDLDFDLPPDLPSPRVGPSGLRLQIPPTLLRQELDRRRLLPGERVCRRGRRAWSAPASGGRPRCAERWPSSARWGPAAVSTTSTRAAI